MSDARAMMSRQLSEAESSAHYSALAATESAATERPGPLATPPSGRSEGVTMA